MIHHRRGGFASAGGLRAWRGVAWRGVAWRGDRNTHSLTPLLTGLFCGGYRQLAWAGAGAGRREGDSNWIAGAAESRLSTGTLRLAQRRGEGAGGGDVQEPRSTVHVHGLGREMAEWRGREVTVMSARSDCL